MATTAAPYGLRPVKRMDGTPYAGAVTHYPIDPAGHTGNIFNGQIVYLNSSGYCTRSDASGADSTTNNFGGSGIGAVGVFVGCEYINAQGQLIHSQYYPSGTTGVATAYVVTDPFVLFQAQLDATGAQTVLGINTNITAVQSTSTGSTRTGNSTSALDADAVATGPFKIVGFASAVGDAYTDVLVKFNPSFHILTDDTTG